MPGEGSGYLQGVKPKKDYYRPLRTYPTVKEQEQREFERRYEGDCPGCGEFLDGLIVTDPHYGLIHELCLRDFYNGRVDGDWWTGGSDV